MGDITHALWTGTQSAWVHDLAPKTYVHDLPVQESCLVRFAKTDAELRPAVPGDTLNHYVIRHFTAHESEGRRYVNAVLMPTMPGAIPLSLTAARDIR